MMRSKRAFIAGLCVTPVLLIVLAVAFAGDASLPHSFVAGTPARAADVNQNFEALRDSINASIHRRTELTYSDLAEDLFLSDRFVLMRTIGNFEKRLPDTDILLTWSSRWNLVGNPWDFGEMQIRIDGNANRADTGRAYLMIYSDDEPWAAGNVSITALFRTLPAGTHTVEIWARSSFGVEIAENERRLPTSVIIDESSGH